jgi:hypothetical protein
MCVWWDEGRWQTDEEAKLEEEEWNKKGGNKSRLFCLFLYRLGESLCHLCN